MTEQTLEKTAHEPIRRARRRVGIGLWATIGIVLLYAIFADQPTLVWVFGGLSLAAYYFLKAEINQIELYLNRLKDAP